jgi:hypothetical protein
MLSKKMFPLPMCINNGKRELKGRKRELSFGMWGGKFML